jgi:hypothetical protein
MEFEAASYNSKGVVCLIYHSGNLPHIQVQRWNAEHGATLSHNVVITSLLHRKLFSTIAAPMGYNIDDNKSCKSSQLRGVSSAQSSGDARCQIHGATQHGNRQLP